MKYFLILIALFSIKLNAQNDLKFDKRNVQCEDKWVTYQMDKDSTYHYGFIYIDSQAGLTFNYEGNFKIDKAGKFIKTSDLKKEATFLKARLEPNKVAIAEIPESRFKELEIQKTPDWLKYYKTNENTVEWLYSRGYMYNGWEECEKALTYLEKANTQNPKFKGLQTELAYAYNALEKFDKAAIALKMAIEDNPKDCYSLKELAFTYCQLSYFDKSIEIYNKMASFCQEKQAVQESAFNLAAAYYRIKDKTKFDYWDKETRKWSTTPNIMTQYLDKYETDMK